MRKMFKKSKLYEEIIFNFFNFVNFLNKDLFLHRYYFAGIYFSLNCDLFQFVIFVSYSNYQTIILFFFNGIKKVNCQLIFILIKTNSKLKDKKTKKHYDVIFF